MELGFPLTLIMLLGEIKRIYVVYKIKKTVLLDGVFNYL
jgi:hypothetical protein